MGVFSSSFCHYFKFKINRSIPDSNVYPIKSNELCPFSGKRPLLEMSVRGDSTALHAVLLRIIFKEEGRSCRFPGSKQFCQSASGRCASSMYHAYLYFLRRPAFITDPSADDNRHFFITPFLLFASDRIVLCFVRGRNRTHMSRRFFLWHFFYRINRRVSCPRSFASVPSVYVSRVAIDGSFTQTVRVRRDRRFGWR